MTFKWGDVWTNTFILCVLTVSTEHERWGRVHQTWKVFDLLVLPGLCLQAPLLRWRCSAEPEASVSVPHSPDDPSYCLLKARDEIHLKNTSAEWQIQTNFYLRVENVSNLREESHHRGQTPQCFLLFTVVQTTRLWTLRLKLTTVRLGRAGDEDEVSLVLPSKCQSPDPIRVLYVELRGGNHSFKIPPCWAAATITVGMVLY